MIRVFLDANVFFAASYSRTGSSRALFRAAIEAKIEIVVSQHVLMEAERNLAQKAPAALAAFRQLSELVVVGMVDKPSLEELERAAAYTALKDAPVVAAAIKAGVDYLLTYDRRHLIDDPRVAEQSGLNIVTPDELMALVGEG